jgi:hypothetical protein
MYYDWHPELNQKRYEEQVAMREEAEYCETYTALFGQEPPTPWRTDWRSWLREMWMGWDCVLDWARQERDRAEAQEKGVYYQAENGPVTWHGLVAIDLVKQELVALAG